MCRICAEYEQGKLTFTEAWRNLREMSPNDPHTEEAAKHIINTKPGEVSESTLDSWETEGGHEEGSLY